MVPRTRRALQNRRCVLRERERTGLAIAAVLLKRSVMGSVRHVFAVMSSPFSVATMQEPSHSGRMCSLNRRETPHKPTSVELVRMSLRGTTRHPMRITKWDRRGLLRRCHHHSHHYSTRLERHSLLWTKTSWIRYHCESCFSPQLSRCTRSTHLTLEASSLQHSLLRLISCDAWLNNTSKMSTIYVVLLLSINLPLCDD